ncbi:hypothetical protein ANCDUO_24087 [Ancylostoma duodenale]|uniref:SCP domain-containing protein n=1 Tax=Ancylostoma duodenale TaxID=51022 RepID=A0A0C2FGN7_9BILA|nr:hypothetical protein ANCDUO_24087 [Ancylostoma duodenale]
MEKCAGCSSLVHFRTFMFRLHNDRFPALGGGQLAKTTHVEFAMNIWTSPLTYYGLKNVSDYANNRLYTFANMANGKTLRFACGYKSCAQNMIHISCIYNLMGGYPHSVLYETGNMCRKNKDCTTYEGSTCDQTSRLCVFKGTPPPPDAKNSRFRWRSKHKVP